MSRSDPKPDPGKAMIDDLNEALDALVASGLSEADAIALLVNHDYDDDDDW